MDKQYCFKWNGMTFAWWSVIREFTTKWGCNSLLRRLSKEYETPDICFGKTDGIPDDMITVDIDPDNDPTYVCDWKELPFENNQFRFGFWDPPYDSLYMKEFKEIWRVCRKLAILHTYFYPKPRNSKRVMMIAVSYGPMKQIRCVQIFRKKDRTLDVFET